MCVLPTLTTLTSRGGPSCTDGIAPVAARLPAQTLSTRVAPSCARSSALSCALHARWNRSSCRARGDGGIYIWRKKVLRLERVAHSVPMLVWSRRIKRCCRKPHARYLCSRPAAIFYTPRS
eukprot:scaffold85746_cov68-Phaeocystis_antarctica.AAC.5